MEREAGAFIPPCFLSSWLTVSLWAQLPSEDSPLHTDLSGSVSFSLSLSCDSSLPFPLRPRGSFKISKCTSPGAQHFPCVPLEPSRTFGNSLSVERLSYHPVGTCPLPPAGARVGLTPFHLAAPRTSAEEPLYRRGFPSSLPPNTYPSISEHKVRESSLGVWGVAPSTNVQIVALVGGWPHGHTAISRNRTAWAGSCLWAGT